MAWRCPKISWKLKENKDSQFGETFDIWHQFQHLWHDPCKIEKLSEIKPPFKGECGTRLTLSNIVGGRKTKFGDYPYMVLIGYDVDGKEFHESVFFGHCSLAF